MHKCTNIAYVRYNIYASVVSNITYAIIARITLGKPGTDK